MVTLTSDLRINRFVYQVVVPKGLADKDLLEVFEKGEKVVLPPWDPMVSFLLGCVASYL
jgi:bleomycin hydrolase